MRSLLEAPIKHYADQPLPPFHMLALCDLSAKLSREYILQNAQRTIDQLLGYTGRQLRRFRRLPYLVVLNPAIAESYETYLATLQLLITESVALPTTAETNQKLVDGALTQLIDLHADALPQLSKGFNEVLALGLMDAPEVRHFLDTHLEDRIKMQLVAQHHVALLASLATNNYTPGSRYNGIITECNAVDLIHKNAEFVNDLIFVKYDAHVNVDVEVVGSEPVLFPYVEYHLDYILTELFKNSFRSHVENRVNLAVKVTVCAAGDAVEIRVRDRGQGINPHVIDDIFEYSFLTVAAADDTTMAYTALAGDDNLVAGMGYGLPLSRNYVEVFNNDGDDHINGSLSLQTYPGWGTDAYLKIRNN